MGNSVYHFNKERLCSCHAACAELDTALAAGSRRPATNTAAGLGLHMAAILAKHGIAALQVSPGRVCH